ncbi:AlpA family phage regulatory protein [Flavobacterium sp.]|uniref:helix-turn-helix transcriptional regulator n=1 Tax=Flavobacterium sp. TaxID=239 RepID=UPI003266CF28
MNIHTDSNFPDRHPPASSAKKNVRRIYRKALICKMLDISSGTVDNMVAAQLFVQPIKIGARSIGFVAEEVDQWLKNRMAARDTKLTKSQSL